MCASHRLSAAGTCISCGISSQKTKETSSQAAQKNSCLAIASSFTRFFRLYSVFTVFTVSGGGVASPLEDARFTSLPCEYISHNSWLVNPLAVVRRRNPRLSLNWQSNSRERNRSSCCRFCYWIRTFIGNLFLGPENGNANWDPSDSEHPVCESEKRVPNARVDQVHCIICAFVFLHLYSVGIFILLFDDEW